MPAPQASYLARTSDKGYDPATLSDDESDSDAGSAASRSTWSADETAILGLVDGPIPKDRLAEELADWKTSRVGGLPSFPLTRAPPQSSSHCLSCSTPMPLLIQLYCPLAHSSLERVLYVFACPSAGCRRKEGAVRVWRANGVWREGRAEEERREREEKERAERSDRAQKVDLGGLVFASSSSSSSASANPFNPFAPPPPSSSSNPFVLPSASAAPAPASAPSASTAPASNPFAPARSNPFAAPDAPPPAPAAAASSSSSSPPRAQTTTSTWAPSPASTLPSYPAQYLTTMYEPASASASRAKGKGKGKERELAIAIEMGLRLDADDDDVGIGSDDDDDDEDGGRRREGKGAGGRLRKGARVAGGDKRKTGSAGAGGAGAEWQKEGYEVQKVKGVDEVFLRFQERVAREGRQVVRYEYGAEPLAYTASSAAYRLLYPSSSSSPDSSIGHYDPLHAPPCRHCRSPSTFEAQLMPHLVSVCPDQDWVTVWVLSCSAECEGGVEGEKEEGESWREERALIEWEEEAV